jgi:GNAT superfamily N-acetyltransferase
VTGPRVRPARPEEAEVVAALFNAINSMDGPPPPVMMTADVVRRDLLGAAPRALLLVAELDGAVVGFVTGNAVYDSMRAADAFFLNDLYVAPEARRRGAGRALVAGLAAVARERGAPCLWWGVDLGDDEALRFYDALGAEDEGGFVGRILLGPAFEALATQETG